MIEREHVLNVHQLIRMFCHFAIIQREAMHMLMFCLNQMMLGLNNHFARRSMYKFSIELDKDIQYYELDKIINKQMLFLNCNNKRKQYL